MGGEKVSGKMHFIVLTVHCTSNVYNKQTEELKTAACTVLPSVFSTLSTRWLSVTSVYFGFAPACFFCFVYFLPVFSCLDLSFTLLSLALFSSNVLS